MKKTVIILLALFTIQITNAQEFDELAQTPPMGWNSWNRFACDVSAKLIKETADAMVSSGMAKAGYEYIVIDDCWQVDRDSLGNIVVDPERFPNGMKEVADYVHSLGLKFGIYSCAGSKTCQKRPGSRGYQFQDARTYASWGVDYLKYDWCYNEEQDAKAAYKTMSDALKATERPIVFSICEWGESKPWEWAKGIGHLWRTTSDIRNYYQGIHNWGGLGVVDIIDKQAELYKYAGPGHWNDADMLEIGNGGLTYNENVTHFSMWAIMASPLMAGNDLRDMPDDIKKILTNKDVIAINQDTLGKQGVKFLDMGEKEVWVKHLTNDDLAVCFLNRNDFAWKQAFDFAWDGIYLDGISYNFEKDEYNMYDVWKHKNIGTTAEPVNLDIPAHGVLMIKLSKTKK